MEALQNKTPSRTFIELDTDRMIGEKEGGIGWITFNNPERRNAVSLAMRIALIKILDDFGNDPNIRVMVLKGSGDKAFVSGSDISEFKDKRSTPEQAAEYQKVSTDLDAAFDNTKKPLIAMIHGMCLGNGLGTALKCDLRISSDTALFGIPAGRLGLVYNYPGVKRVVDLVGPSRAMEMIFTARRFTAHEALQINLVNEVVPFERLEPRVREIAAMIAENAPISIRAGKLMVKEAMKDAHLRDMELCKSLVKEGFSSEDFKEGRTAFMEKRRPQFKGR